MIRLNKVPYFRNLIVIIKPPLLNHIYLNRDHKEQQKSKKQPSAQQPNAITL